MVSKNENKLMKFIQAQTVSTTVMLGSFDKSWGTFFTNIILKILCPEHFYVVYFLQNHYRKVSNRSFGARFYSKISLKSLFCPLLFKPRFYLEFYGSSIWNFENSPYEKNSTLTLVHRWLGQKEFAECV